MVVSSNVESGHASNKHTVPTKLIDIIDIKKQVLEFEDQCIQCDISELKKLELHRLSKRKWAQVLMNGSHYTM